MNPHRKRDRRRVRAEAILRELDDQTLRDVVRAVEEAVRYTDAQKVRYQADQLRIKLGQPRGELALDVPDAVVSFYATLSRAHLIAVRDALSLEAFNGSNSLAVNARILVLDRMLAKNEETR